MKGTQCYFRTAERVCCHNFLWSSCCWPCVVLPGHEASKASSWPRECIFQALAYAHNMTVPLHPPTDSSVGSTEVQDSSLTAQFKRNWFIGGFWLCRSKNIYFGIFKTLKMEQPGSLVLILWILVSFNSEMEVQGLKVREILFTLSTDLPFTSRIFSGAWCSLLPWHFP